MLEIDSFIYKLAEGFTFFPIIDELFILLSNNFGSRRRTLI